MSYTKNIEPLRLDFTGNIAATNLRHVSGATTYAAGTADAAHEFRGSGIEAGGRIVLGTATTADVLVKDSTGVVLYNATVTVNTDVAPIPRGVTGPITVTITNISNAAHTLSVYWWVKK